MHDDVVVYIISRACTKEIKRIFIYYKKVYVHTTYYSIFYFRAQKFMKSEFQVKKGKWKHTKILNILKNIYNY